MIACTAVVKMELMMVGSRMATSRLIGHITHGPDHAVGFADPLRPMQGAWEVIGEAPPCALHHHAKLNSRSYLNHLREH